MFPGMQSFFKSKIMKDKKKNLEIPSKYLPELKHPKIIQIILQNIQDSTPKIMYVSRKRPPSLGNHKLMVGSASNFVIDFMLF